MTSPLPSDAPEPTGVQRKNDGPPADILVSITTAPALLLFLGARSFSNFVQQLGLASEEIFRGDRLPTLNMPAATADAIADPDTQPE